LGLAAWPALLLAAIALSPGGAAAAADAIVRQPIRAGAEIAYPPFSLRDAQGRADGFAVELLRAALKAMDRTVSFRTGPWAEVKGRLAEDRLDALPLVGRTPEREALFDFTVPYMTLHGAIVVRADRRDVHGLADLAGGRVAVMRGDNAEEFLRREPRDFAIVTPDTFAAALRQLAAGRHDAVVIPRLVALRLIQQLELEGLRVVDAPIEDFRQDFCFAVTEGDRQTLALLNEGLALVMADGTFRQLHAKWFAGLELPSKRRLVVGGDEDYPPFEFIDQHGLPAGYNVDLIRAVARELGLEIDIRLGPWAEVRRALQRGEIDVIQGMLYSPARDRDFDFTAPHTVNHYVAVVRAGEGDPPATAAALAGKRIAVQRGDLMHDWALERGLGGALALVADQEQALRQLAAGEHDCALVSRLTALYEIEAQGIAGLRVGKRALASAGYCFAVDQGQDALLAKLGEGLKILEETGEYRRIYEKWMGVYEEPALDWREVIEKLAFVLVPLALLVLGFVLWTWSLRRQVARRSAELARSRDALVQAQKLEAVGRLAGGVAHDFNNMLGVMIGYLELVEQELGPDHPVRPDLDEIAAAARRSADLTRQLLAFARKQTIAPRVLDLNRAVAGTLNMLRRLIGEDKQLVWKPADEPGAVEIDPAQLDQILANLCINARDAIAGNGTITIATEQVVLDEAYCAERPDCRPGDYVVLAVSDDGRGMDAATRDKAFEPFFTTKDLGQGTGLGLATVYGIVQQNQGFTQLDSEPGRGTSVRIHLPRHAGPERAEGEPAGDRLPAGRGETVLVVEDEPAVIKLAARILTDLGYQVLSAGTPGQALAEAERHGAAIDLLLTDVVMPEMTGRELADRLRDKTPGLRVLYMSGYTDDVIARHGVLDQDVHFVPKPFTRRALALEVRAVLDAGEKPGSEDRGRA
jgi:ABC-type amino acid transport substrate-binding protein/nitrogen-specific signal transduction histidine kinase/ActR/RegA family two-component response regulator